MRSMLAVLSKAHVIFPMLKDFFTGKYSMPLGRFLMFLFVLVYLIFPVDIIPDFIIGLGWLDDLLLFGYASKFMDEELRKYKHFRDFKDGKPVVLPQKWK